MCGDVPPLFRSVLVYGVYQEHKTGIIEKHYAHSWPQGLSQDLETGCLKLAIVKFLGVQNFKGDYSILIFQP